MRTPRLLCLRPVDDTYVTSTEARRRQYSCINADINLPVRDVVAALHTVMLEVQRRVGPTVTFSISQHDYGYSIAMRWSSASGQLQLEGHADELGISFNLTSAFGHTFEMDNSDKLVWWSCSRNDWMNRGDLDLYRFEGPHRSSTYLSTSLSVFDGIKVSERHGYHSWQGEPVRPDLIDDIVKITQVYVSAL